MVHYAMASAVAPLVVLVLGGFIYTASGNSKVAEMGRIAYFVGLLWLIYGLANHTVRF